MSGRKQSKLAGLDLMGISRDDGDDDNDELSEWHVHFWKDDKIIFVWKLQTEGDGKCCLKLTRDIMEGCSFT